jgi:predicted O-methyltransferase YrrM
VHSFFQIKSFLNHWLDAVDDHSIHSPFFYDFYNRVVKEKNDPLLFLDIEKTRAKLLSNHSLVTVKDMGDASYHFNSDQRSISQVAATSLNNELQCQLYYRIAKSLEAKNILELGTSMGITSLYLARVKDSRITTLEGNQAMINIARTNFEYFNQKNINLIEGNIDQTLPEFLQHPARFDFVLMDANHRYEPTIRYFNWLVKRIADKGIIVIDDIYRSPEMVTAWKALHTHDLVYASIDLFHCGILFFDINLNRQHFTWQL